MAGGFDAGQALRGGIGDRRQAWEFIRRFAAAWATPLAPGAGVSRDAWLAAEDRFGAELPAALREAYLLFGRRPDLTARQDRLVPPLDGRGPRCWLLAAAQTPADLEAIRAAVPGSWARIQWPGRETG